MIVHTFIVLFSYPFTELVVLMQINYYYYYYYYFCGLQQVMGTKNT